MDLPLRIQTSADLGQVQGLDHPKGEGSMDVEKNILFTVPKKAGNLMH